ncbi:RNA-binding cell elongation regulator Jag/EloR [Floricoccus penangensis]|uniref:RNA-binding cell elongation regulator Jag/EloR n=1 Tax=Floricoccus penangensis TaxID=1859475 RepID=UPI00203B1275|nr:RNA-binding cell elongation regulator Jag/EloR [Floricoccus penangensis]URZ87263.1 Jag N-terminal domain-containing protein [Floricoccus penangensis]
MVVFTGETVEKAIERGLARLGVSREKVHIEIEQHEKKGFLGFGVKRARVNIDIISEETQLKADRLAIRGTNRTTLGGQEIKSSKEATVELSKVIKAVRQAEKEAGQLLSDEEKQSILAGSSNLKEEDSIVSEEVTTDIGDTDKNEILPDLPVSVLEVKQKSTSNQTTQPSDVSKISKYLSDITKEMGIPTSVQSYYDEELDNIVFNLTSEQDGLLIGKHGKILQSLQLIAQAYASTLFDNYLKITVDVAGYLDKRQAFLKSLARNAIEKAKKGETAYINDLQSFERKMIHSMVSKEPGISSHSEGQDSRRYIVVRKEY